MSSFPERLKYLRKQKEYTQDELSKRLGISRSTLAMYEQGNREPDFETQEKIADFFNVNLDYLMGRSDVKATIFVNSPYASSILESVFKSAMRDLKEKYTDEDYDFEDERVGILSEQEEYLVLQYRDLSKKGKDMVLSYLEFLLKSEMGE